MESIPRHICPAVLFAQAVCSSKKMQRRQSEQRKRISERLDENRVKEMMDRVRQCDTVKGKDGKTPTHIILLLLG